MFHKKIRKIVTIEGMMCNHCKNKVESSLKELENVTKVKVNLANKKAEIYSNAVISDEDIKKTITNLGYQVTNIEGK
ncbi:heavy-metal-associated domain-containing protein [bacterium]|uniref:heavy-metal-associated domain-containing protein n=1 Tax=Candidatus Ventrenecus sp. TaxID=3085654 RepID=UPI001D47C535|nr:heavy-metal-associated domain-containing protein [bacterium]